jgi:hypothetical protein
MYQFATGVYDDVNELAEALTFSADSTDYWAI